MRVGRGRAQARVPILALAPGDVLQPEERELRVLVGETLGDLPRNGELELGEENLFGDSRQRASELWVD